MEDYRVTWEIDVSAETPEDAAMKARRIQLDPASSATVFKVALDQGDGPQVTVDLGYPKGSGA
jgi:hypothetical protein